MKAAKVDQQSEHEAAITTPIMGKPNVMESPATAEKGMAPGMTTGLTSPTVVPATPSTLVAVSDAEVDETGNVYPPGEDAATGPPGSKKPKKDRDPMMAQVAHAEVTKATYTTAYASASTLITECKVNVASAAYSWANQPVILKPVVDALDALASAMRTNSTYKKLVEGDIKKLRSDAKKKKAIQEFDSDIMMFNKLIPPKVGELQVETRLLSAAISAREDQKAKQDAEAADKIRADSKGATKKKKKRKVGAHPPGDVRGDGAPHRH